MSLRDTVQELRELGPRGTLFRAGWELKTRARSTAYLPPVTSVPTPSGGAGTWQARLRLEDSVTVGRGLRNRIPAAQLELLRRRADQAVDGKILCFGRWTADFGSPIDWHRNPRTGLRWNPSVPAFRALADERPGDVKYAWEAARFPHAYHMARAATFFPERADAYQAALYRQIEWFLLANPVGYGIHWASGQEVAFRMFAWIFALHAFPSERYDQGPLEDAVGKAIVVGAAYIEEHLDYARIAVYNNHLLSEAVALLAAGVLLPDASSAPRWREVAWRLLDAEADRQFYQDGGYIQQSHNYHRVALQVYLWACLFARSLGDRPSARWLKAMERSLEFLLAFQNPADGRLPNYGSNDGAMPSVLSVCDFQDLRPVLQAVSVLTRGERVYEPGPWDESSAWFLGVRALDAPLRTPVAHSASFPVSGHHVLRGNAPGSYGAFRCGSLRDRFSQIDMLHLDVWWRGQNVLVDAGSFQYNAAPRWHEHFLRTSSHNTVMVDGHDQMVHHRQFKVLYWTKARLLSFDDQGTWARCEGEHDGYRRYPGDCVHRRAVLFVKDDLWVVVDSVIGTGSHDLRLQWLGGPYPWAATPSGMTLETSAGPFSVAVFDSTGAAVEATVVAGGLDPKRGWLSRYYGERVAVPSLVVETRAEVPATFVSILSASPRQVSVDGGSWTIRGAGGEVTCRIVDGRIEAPVLS